MILTARRRETAARSSRAFRERLPGVTGVLDHVDDRRVIQVRMIAVPADAEEASSDDADVIRLRRVREALPVLGESVLVRELRHVRGGTVDVRQVVVLHEDDDELIEIIGGLGEHGSGAGRIAGREDREESPGREHEDDQEEGCDQGRGRVRSRRRTN